LLPNDSRTAAVIARTAAVEKEILRDMSRPELWKKQTVAARRESLFRILAQQVASEQDFSMDQYLEWKVGDAQPSLFPQLSEAS
jgi:hypothetical protein